MPLTPYKVFHAHISSASIRSAAGDQLYVLPHNVLYVLITVSMCICVILACSEETSKQLPLDLVEGAVFVGRRYLLLSDNAGHVWW